MGVRGLTTFIANRSYQYLETYELHDCYLVVDGNSIASQLYKWHCKCNDCFGGDYDKYANVIYNFFQLLSDCGVTPLVVFDGAYEKRKMKTVYSRMKNKISAAKDLNCVTEDRVSMFPLFLREIFADILQKLNVKCVRCDFEGDSDAAYLARNLNCPVVSYDSDFYIFDVLYIPFSTVDLKVRKTKSFKYIPCKVYKVDKFLNSFGGLNKINLPLLAVLLGNDYIKKSTFAHFYHHLKMQKCKQNEQQRLIKSIIVWLKDETPDSALRKILGRYKLRNRRKIAGKIQTAIEGYQCVNTKIFSYFNVDSINQRESCIKLPKPEEIEDIEEEEEIEEDISEDEEQDSAEDTPEEEVQVEITQDVHELNAPTFFKENFTRCLYPSCFMDMMVSHTYYCIPQVEDFSLEHSHTVSLEILSAIHKILTYPDTPNLICVARNEYSHIKKFSLPIYSKNVPRLSEIENLDLKKFKTIFLDIINIRDERICNLFPSSWHLFLISLRYWVTNSKHKIEMPYIYSVVICGIILNYVDSKVGFCRSTRSFLAKYSAHVDSAKSFDSEKNIMKSLDQIDVDDSVSCMKKLIHYFQMDAKMKSNVRLFDRSIVHEFAQFQSCLLHIKYLNSLLNCPFPTFLISDFYDGTFLYNMTTNLLKRTNLKSYMQILLESCPKILNIFELMIEQIEEQISSEIGKHEPPKKRKKRKKSKMVIIEEDAPVESDEDYVLDSNNRYSLLSFMNK